MSIAKVATLASLGPQWTAGDRGWASDDLDLDFGRRACRLLDVGTGDGVACRAWAGEHPDWDVLAVEMHRPGLARLVRDLDASGPTNVRVAEGDVTRLAGDSLARGSVHAVRILFPDPWPKRRHHERRLVDAGFLGLLADLLPPGGWVHVATDSDSYAEQVRAVLAVESRLQPAELLAGRFGDSWQSIRPDRPVTPYERRALTSGRPITDLVAQRVNQR